MYRNVKEGKKYNKFQIKVTILIVIINEPQIKVISISSNLPNPICQFSLECKHSTANPNNLNERWNSKAKDKTQKSSNC